MRPVWLLVLATSGCRGVLGIEEAIAIDGPPASCASWHPVGFDPCAFEPAPALRLGPGQYSYDTTSGDLRDASSTLLHHSGLAHGQPDGPTVAVLSVEALSLAAGAALSVTGSRPLLVVAWSTIQLDGTIDASSHVGVDSEASHLARTVTLGPGASEGCGAGAGKQGLDASTGGSGGGGGGGFGSQGGAGGAGGTAPASGGAGGAAAAPSGIRAGCPGGASGATSSAPAGTRSAGGAGGGALRFAAHDKISVGATAAIGANGAGGAGAPASSGCGGGGGGSGGYLGFDAPIVSIAGTVTANGGGGGGGGGSAGFGYEGSDGLLDLQSAPGGAVTTDQCGRPGGAGASLGQPDGASGDSFNADCETGGGGGGGGASGYIFVASPAFTAAASARISPAITPQ